MSIPSATWAAKESDKAAAAQETQTYRNFVDLIERQIRMSVRQGRKTTYLFRRDVPYWAGSPEMHRITLELIKEGYHVELTRIGGLRIKW